MRVSLQSFATLSALALCQSLAPAAIAQPVARLQLQNQSPYVDLVTVLPGERLPLRATDHAGRVLAVTWRAAGGALSQGDGLAVWKAPLRAGAYALTGTATSKGRMLTRTLQAIVTVPATNVRGGRLNGYPIGTYPRGFGAGGSLVASRGARKGYAVPLGFVELSAATMDVPVSTHYKVRDFAGKDGFVNGKKYLFIEPRLVEKLERGIEALKHAGYRARKLELMSAYRSPYLNGAIGNTTTLSRHTYGDAADVLASDFDGNGRVDRKDGQILFSTFDKLDRETGLTGGASLYPPTSAHGYFVHTDTRGHAARW